MSAPHNPAELAATGPWRSVISASYSRAYCGTGKAAWLHLSCGHVERYTGVSIEDIQAQWDKGKRPVRLCKRCAASKQP